MANELTGKRVASLAAKGVEKIELVEPRHAVEQAGATTTLLSVPDGVQDGTVQSVQDDTHPDDTFPVDALVGDVSADDFDALLLPGGAVNPDTLRQDPDAVAFVRAFITAGKPLGVICHGPWTLVEADVLRGRTLTSFPACAPTCATPARWSWTSRSSSMGVWCPAAARTTSPPSAGRSSRSSPPVPHGEGQ